MNLLKQEANNKYMVVSTYFRQLINKNLNGTNQNKKQGQGEERC